MVAHVLLEINSFERVRIDSDPGACRVGQGLLLRPYQGLWGFPTRKTFFALTFGAKIALCAAFVLIRADEYHQTLTGVLRKISAAGLCQTFEG